MSRRVNLLPSSRLLVTVLSVAFCSVASAQSIDSTRIGLIPRSPFRIAQSFALTPAPTSVASGDLNVDGHADLVVTRAGSGSVSVLLGNGKGGFSAGVAYPAGTTVSNALVADFNGDGKLDVAVTDSAAGSVDILFGNGDGTLSAPVVYSALANPVALTTGHFTNSGKVDLAVASSTGLAVLLNDGTGKFSAAAVVPITVQPLSLAAADLKSAGHDDLILASQNGSLTVLVGDGAGHFAAQPAFSVASGPLSSVIAGDFNADGKADLAVAQGSSNIVTVLLGKGDGTFQSGTPYVVGNGPAKLIAANLTGSSATDLVSINQLANTFSVLVGNPDGTFRPSIDFVAGNLPLGVVAADFNGDGKADLAIANSQDQNIAVPLGKGDGTFAATRSYRADLMSKAVAAGDLNGDGRSDLVVANFCGSDATCTSNGTATVFLANTDGTYRAASTIPLGLGPAAIALANLHGTGKLDLIALNSTDKTLSILAGNGDGTFGALQRYSLAASPHAVLVGDFNGDGKADLAIASDCGQSTCTQPGTLDIWLGHGDGSLSASASYAVGFSPVSIAAADLRSTGHLDVVVANACGDDSTCKSSGTATVFTNDGTGKLTASGEVSLGSAPSAIALGNLGGNGLDLAVAQRGSNQVAVLHSNGNGTFAAAVTYAVGTAPSALAIADFNGDGQADLAVANAQSSNVSVLYGASGKLETAVNIPVASDPESLVAVSGSAGHAGIVTTNGSAAMPMGGGATPLGGSGTDTSSISAFTNTPSSSTVNVQVTLSATVTGDGTDGTPTGNVVFAIDNSGTTTPITDCNGSTGETLSMVDANDASTSCVTQQLPAGTVMLQAQYQGDSTYAGINSSDITQTVTMANTTVTLGSLAATGTVDQSVSLSATVAPATTPTTVADTVAFTGTMAFQSNGVNLSDCSASTVTFNSTTGTATASCPTSVLTAGSDNITASYNGDGNYNTSPASGASSINVSAANTTVTMSNTVTPSSPAVNQAITVSATVAPSTGSVVVPFSGSSMEFLNNGTAISSCTAQPVNATTGVASCTIPAGLTAGSYNITAEYNAGDSNYNASAQSASLGVTVGKANTTVTVNTASPSSPTVDQVVTLNATVAPSSGSATVPFSGSGTITFSVGGTPVCSGTASTAGAASCQVTAGITAGSQSVTAVYNGDSNYNSSPTSGTLSLTVAKAATQAAVSPSPSSTTVDQSVTLTATIAPNVSSNEVSTGNIASLAGNVQFSDNGTSISSCTSQSATFSSSTGTATATCVTSALAAGTHSNIVATYLGNTNYNSSPNSTPTTVTVSPASTTVAVTSNPVAPALNQSVTFTASVTFPSPLTITPTGTDTVSFSDNGSPITNCGTGNTTITATGTVNVYQATCQLSSLSGGSHAILATFNGDSNYSSSTGNLSVSVGLAPPSSVTVTSSQTTSVVNQPVTFTVAVTGGTTVKLTGTVTVTADSTNTLGQCTLGGWSSTTGIASCSIPAVSSLGVGSHPITAAYSGDSNYGSSTGSMSSNQVVNKATTSLALSSTSSVSTVNQAVTFSATVTPQFAGTTVPSGTVTFTATPSGGSATAICSTTTLPSSGVATCNDASLAAGAYTITATYSGDTSFSTSNNMFGQTVNQAATVVSLSSSGSPSTVSQSVTFTATITGNPSGSIPLAGKVSFSDSVSGAIPSCPPVTLSGGATTAVCTTNALIVGAHTITATYSGDPNFAGGSNTFTQNVAAAAATITLRSSSQLLSANTYTSTVNQSVTFTATFPVPSGTTPSKTVSFTDNGGAIANSSCTTLAVSGGNASETCTTSALLAGTHTIVATYSGDPNITVSSGLITQQVLQAPSSTVLVSSSTMTGPSTYTSTVTNPNNVNDQVTFTATVAPSSGAVPLSGTVSFSDNGAILTGCAAQPVSAAGVATCAPAAPGTGVTTLASGVNSIVATYSEPSGSANFISSTGTITQNVSDFSLSAATAPPVTVTAGFTTSSDLFTAQTISVGPVSTLGFSTASGSPLTVTCSITNSSNATVTAPACNLFALGTTIKATTLAVVASGAQPALSLVVDATSAAAGNYNVTITGTDPTTGLVHTASFPVIVRTQATALQIASGATTNNVGTVTFQVPSGVTLSNFSCPSLAGSGISAANGVKPSNFGIACSFGTPTSSGSTVTLTVTVTTNNTITTSSTARHSDLLVAGMLGLPLFGLMGLLSRKRGRMALFQLMGLVAIAIATLQTMGCGGSFHSSGGSTASGGTTPPGVYYLLVQGIGSDGKTYQAVLPVDVTVL